MPKRRLYAWRRSCLVAHAGGTSTAEAFSLTRTLLAASSVSAYRSGLRVVAPAGLSARAQPLKDVAELVVVERPAVGALNPLDPVIAADREVDELCELVRRWLSRFGRRRGGSRARSWRVNRKASGRPSVARTLGRGQPTRAARRLARPHAAPGRAAGLRRAVEVDRHA
jgi:hypothetical protein